MGCLLVFCFELFACNTLQAPKYHSRRIQGETSLYYNYDLNFKLNLGFEFKIRDEGISKGNKIRPLQSNLYSFEQVNSILNQIIHKDYKDARLLFQSQSMSRSFVKVIGLLYEPKNEGARDNIVKQIVHYVSKYRDLGNIKPDSSIILSKTEDYPNQKAYKYFTVFSFKRKSFGLIDYYLPFQGKLLRFIFCGCLTDGFYENYEKERFKLPAHAGNLNRSKLEIFEEDYASEIMASFGPIRVKPSLVRNNDYFHYAFESLNTGIFPNFLLPLIDLRKAKPIGKDSIYDSFYEQARKTYQCLAGNYDSISTFSHSNYSLSSGEKYSLDRSIEGFHPQNARDYIKKNALNKQVVMFNESHVNYQHRRFEESLLKDFYEAGFRYLAIEGLDYKDSLLNQRKIPLVTTGYYCREPAFGNLIRRALNLGFTLIPYEDTSLCHYKTMNCNFRRDSMMAYNLSKILNIDHKAKILVHAGYDHIDKKTSLNVYPMAKRFKEITGIDPYCINQTLLSENGSGSDPKLIKYLKDKFNPDSPIVFSDDTGKTWIDSSNKAYSDVYIYHPFSPNLFESEVNLDYSEKLDLSFPETHGSHQEFITQVFILTEYQEFKNLTQPVFQKSFYDTFDPFYIYLPPNDYIILFKDQDGNIIREWIKYL